MEIDARFAGHHDPLFDSAWLKLSHGLAHAKALDAEIDDFSSRNSDEEVLFMQTDYVPRRHGFSVYVTDIAPMPSRWGLMLGDVAHNYRSALDHLAWSLVCRGHTPPAQLTRQQQAAVYFPISPSRPQFNAEIRKPPTTKSLLKLPGIRRADAAKIRRRQPYRYSARRRGVHFLTVLAALNNGGKHRTIQPVWVYPTRVRVQIDHTEDCVVSRLGQPRGGFGPMEVGSEVAFIRVRRMGPEPYLDASLGITVQPGIANRIGVKKWIWQCGCFTALLVRELSAPPPEVHERRDLWEWVNSKADDPLKLEI
jgi:hypothetical protein